MFDHRYLSREGSQVRSGITVMRRKKGKVLFVTGGTSGINLGIRSVRTHQAVAAAVAAL